MFAPDTTPRRTPGAEASRFGGEVIVLDAEGRTLRGLNPTAALVFELCDGTRTVRQIAQAVAARFEVTPDRALDDTRAFLEVLREKGLVLPP